MRFFPVAVALFAIPTMLFGQLTDKGPSIGLRGNTIDFIDVTAKRLVSTVSEQSSNEKEVAFGDFDNDGDPDVVIANGLSDFTRRRNKLYINQNGVFQEVSGTEIIPSFADVDHSRKSLVRDFDNDGWLDIVIVNDKNAHPGDIHKFLHNKHPGDVFSHFANETFRLNGAENAGASGVALDVDNDSDVDLFIAAHPFLSQDILLLNDGTGNFTNVTDSSIPPAQDYGNDAAYADFNGDKKPDLLVTNMLGDPSLILYNNLNNLGSATGDYHYPGSRQFLGGGSRMEGMEPGDFNFDGRVDIYASNYSGTTGDVLLINQGNDASGKAIFTQHPVAGIVSDSSSRKATVADLNKDGRPDVIVMSMERRPVVFRNTSVNGEVSFVEWTPATAFPDDNRHHGMQCAVFDSNQDGRADVFVGGNSGDHLFEQRLATTVKENSLNGQLPNIHRESPIAVLGTGVNSEVDSFAASDVPAGAEVSIVLRSGSDVVLTVRSDGVMVANSDRGGLGVEESLQLTAPGPLTIEVEMANGASSRRSYVLEVLSR